MLTVEEAGAWAPRSYKNIPLTSPQLGPPLWVGHRPGRARLGMGVGAIGAFAPKSGSDSSEEYRIDLHHGTDATGHGAPGSPQWCSTTRSSVKTAT